MDSDRKDETPSQKCGRDADMKFIAALPRAGPRNVFDVANPPVMHALEPSGMDTQMLNNTFVRMDISLRKGNAAVLAWGGPSLSSPAYRSHRVSAQEQV